MISVRRREATSNAEGRNKHHVLGRVKAILGALVAALIVSAILGAILIIGSVVATIAVLFVVVAGVAIVMAALRKPWK